jgi:hypothetical protein
MCAERRDTGPRPSAEAITQAIVDALAENGPHVSHGQGGYPGYYGVRVENVSADGAEFDLVFTFKAGERYCCAEFNCHATLYCDDGWLQLRHYLRRHGLGAIPRLTIRKVRGVVEKGAQFFKQDRQDLGHCESEAFEYEIGPYVEPERGEGTAGPPRASGPGRGTVPLGPATKPKGRRPR